MTIGCIVACFCTSAPTPKWLRNLCTVPGPCSPIFSGSQTDRASQLASYWHINSQQSSLYYHPIEHSTDFWILKILHNHDYNVLYIFCWLVKGRWVSGALQWHFKNTSMALPQHLHGTSMALPQHLHGTFMPLPRHFNGTSTVMFLSALVERFSVSRIQDITSPTNLVFFFILTVLFPQSLPCEHHDGVWW